MSSRRYQTGKSTWLFFFSLMHIRSASSVMLIIALYRGIRFSLFICKMGYLVRYGRPIGRCCVCRCVNKYFTTLKFINQGTSEEFRENAKDDAHSSDSSSTLR